MQVGDVDHANQLLDPAELLPEALRVLLHPAPHPLIDLHHPGPLPHPRDRLPPPPRGDPPQGRALPPAEAGSRLVQVCPPTFPEGTRKTARPHRLRQEGRLLHADRAAPPRNNQTGQGCRLPPEGTQESPQPGEKHGDCEGVGGVLQGRERSEEGEERGGGGARGDEQIQIRAVAGVGVI